MSVNIQLKKGNDIIATEEDLHLNLQATEKVLKLRLHIRDLGIWTSKQANAATIHLSYDNKELNTQDLLGPLDGQVVEVTVEDSTALLQSLIEKATVVEAINKGITVVTSLKTT